jgi:hypothetical protein
MSQLCLCGCSPDALRGFGSRTGISKGSVFSLSLKHFVAGKRHPYLGVIGFVWTEPKQMAIIDSILRNYYIPPVIFHVSYDSTGEEKRVAIGEPDPHI